MITTELVNNIFEKYNSLPVNADIVTERNLHDLMDFAFESPYVDFEGERLVFSRGEGPLRSVEINRITGAHDMGSHMAIVLPASMIMINKSNGVISVYLPD